MADGYYNNNGNETKTIHEGVRKEDVKKLVEEILQNPSYNIKPVPEVVQRIVYKSTIKLTLNIFYKLLSRLDGYGLLSAMDSNGSNNNSNRPQQQIEIHRQWIANSIDEGQHFRQQGNFQVNKTVLYQVADKLLTIKAFNQTLIPDVAEREIYVSCLKVIFYVVHIITSHVNLSVCGHSIGLTMASMMNNSSNNFSTSRQHNNDNNNQWIEQRTNQTVSLLSAVSQDKQKLQQFAERSGMVLLDDNDRNIVQKLPSMQQKLVSKLNMSLYGLMIGVIDDMLATTKIQLLSDQISFQIKPAQQSTNNNNNNTNMHQQQYQQQQYHHQQQPYPPPPPSPHQPPHRPTWTSSSLPTYNTPYNQPRQSAPPAAFNPYNSTPTPMPSWNNNDPNNNYSNVRSMPNNNNNARSMGFEQDREFLRNRFREWTPEQRQIMLKELQDSM